MDRKPVNSSKHEWPRSSILSSIVSEGLPELEAVSPRVVESPCGAWMLVFRGFTLGRRDE